MVTVELAARRQLQRAGARFDRSSAPHHRTCKRIDKAERGHRGLVEIVDKTAIAHRYRLAEFRKDVMQPLHLLAHQRREQPARSARHRALIGIDLKVQGE